MSTLTTISGASVVFDNVGSASNVFWQVGSSATLGSTTAFIGTIIAAHDITLVTGATVNGRVLARGVTADGAVILDTNTITVPDSTAPTVTVTMDDDALNIGDTSLVTFTFSEAPVGFSADDVTVANGSIGAIDASVPLIQTAVYTPTPGITDAFNVITVGTVWTDAASNAGVGDDSPNYTIDTVAPTVTVTMDDNALNIGDTALVTFTFSETPVGFSTDDVTVANGSIGAIDASVPLVQTAVYTPTPGITDAFNVITVGTVWTDAALNAGISDDSPNYTIDTVAPTVFVTMDDDALTVGDTALVTFTFSETPVGFSTDDVTVANGSIGAIDASVPLVQTAVYTPTPGITDAFNVITVGTVWTDAASNAGVGDDSPNYTIATVSGSQLQHQAAAGTINVVKIVVNDNSGTKTVSDFPLFVNGILVVSGVTNTFFPAATYSVTETSDLTRYTRTFSGDCDAAGHLSLNAGQNKVCIITNNDIGAPLVVPPVPPLIDVVKVPSPLALPDGPGPVTYTYTVRNIGTVPMTDVTMVGDSCSPIVLDSGDLNRNAKLDVNETWVSTCSTILTQTYTNTVVATGWANSLSAVDIASATVVVGVPIAPPLIHLTKIPSPLALFAGGGMVTYTEKITNPGAAALSNVRLTDDKCSPMKRISGDTNNDSNLDIDETWTYTCSSKLTKTTTNTATATGEANGFTMRDFAVATVVVAAAVPTLPKTGIAPTENVIAWGVSAAGLLGIAFLLYVLWKKQNV